MLNVALDRLELPLKDPKSLVLTITPKGNHVPHEGIEPSI